MATIPKATAGPYMVDTEEYFGKRRYILVRAGKTSALQRAIRIKRKYPNASLWKSIHGCWHRVEP